MCVGFDIDVVFVLYPNNNVGALEVTLRSTKTFPLLFFEGFEGIKPYILFDERHF